MWLDRYTIYRIFDGSTEYFVKIIKINSNSILTKSIVDDFEIEYDLTYFKKHAEPFKR